MTRRKRRPAIRILSALLGCLLVLPPAGLAQIVKPMSVQRGEQEQLLSIRHVDAPIQVVLEEYASLTGRTLIMSPSVPAVLVSLKSEEKLTETEYLVALESILAMNQIVLIPMGDKFLKVVPAAELRTHGEAILMGVPGEDDEATDKLETRVIELKYLDLTAVQPLIDSLRHPYGKVQMLEKTNAFMITDTVSVLHRISELISYLDKPSEAKVETRVYRLANADATEIASRLGELIETSDTGRPQTRSTARSTASAPGGVIRAGTTAAQRAAAAAAAARQSQSSTQTASDLAERGIVQGEVKLVPDERTNILIVISEPVNFTFFDRIVELLDEQVDPAIAVEVVRLEFADAEEISTILNDFVGAATADSQRNRTANRTSTTNTADSRAQALRDFVARQNSGSQQTAASAASLAAGVGRLSEDTRILADQRTNSILLMGNRSDITALQGIVEQLDVMLAQVMIEAVIIEVSLDDNIQYGIDWLQRSYELYNEERLGPGGSIGVQQPVVGFGGGQNFNNSTFIDGGLVTRQTELAAGALNYYATFYDLNVDAVIRLAAGSSQAKILSTPLVVTTDNTEARIIVGESRPIVASTSVTAGGVDRSSYQYQEIGIELTVTPRINPEKFVVMEIQQTADNVGGFQVIDGNNVPVITRREMEAQIAVENRSSIVLGGLMSTDSRKGRTKIPLLGDIPIVGTLFRSDDNSENRRELIVVITPYVMATPEEVRQESERINERSMSDQKWDLTWSDSPLFMEDDPDREPIPPPVLDPALEEMLRQRAATGTALLDAVAPPQVSSELEPYEPIAEEVTPQGNGDGDDSEVPNASETAPPERGGPSIRIPIRVESPAGGPLDGTPDATSPGGTGP